jgi:hypothetical protein
LYDTMNMGPTPCDEPCQQVPYDNPGLAMAECRAYINQLRRINGDPPTGVRFKISRNPHDFGTYHEAAVEYDDQYKEQVEYALKVEANLPSHWDNEAEWELARFRKEQQERVRSAT